ILRKVNLDETLIVVTGDQSHKLTIAGYAKRGNPILGISVGDDGEPILAADGKPYTTINFANGPGGIDISKLLAELEAAKAPTEADAARAPTEADAAQAAPEADAAQAPGEADAAKAPTEADAAQAPGETDGSNTPEGRPTIS